MSRRGRKTKRVREVEKREREGEIEMRSFMCEDLTLSSDRLLLMKAFVLNKLWM